MSLIEIRGIVFEYAGGIRILDNINLSIEEGTITTILGLNGCGKTTLIKLLSGLMKPASGEITIKGIPVLSMSDHDRSKLIAYVPQFASNHIPFTVKNYLALSLTNQKSIYWQPSREDYAAVEEFAKSMNISESNLNKRVDELSGGERQIVMICGALLQDAEIIILDEPTAALDMRNQFLVLKFLKRCHSTQKKTIILSSHDPNHAIRLGGNVVAMHKGRFFLSGDSREIICAEKLRDVYGDFICDSKRSMYNYIVLEW